MCPCMVWSMWHFGSFAICVTSNLEFDTMTKRKPFDEQGGSSQKANRAKAVAAEHGVVDDVQQPKRRRRNLADEHCGYATLDSQAAWNWLQRWSWGKMSSIAVQQKAFNNYMDYQRMLYKVPLNDGWIPRSIQDLAQLGTWGGNPGNINRELKHWLGEFFTKANGSHSANDNSKAKDR